MGIPDPAAAFSEASRFIWQHQPERAEPILRELVRAFPAELIYNEKLVEALVGTGQFEESLALFCDLLVRFQPTGDAEYDATYVNGLRATGSSPAPFRRLLRFYALVNQLEKTKGVAGEVVECGCFRGMSSFLLCSYLRRERPAFCGAGYHIFDSFEGLAEPTIDDEVPEEFANSANLKAMSRRGAFAASMDAVKRSLAAFPDIEYHAGWIPASFRNLPPRTYRFAHIDVDHFDPTWDCLEYFYPRMAEGGILISDDYSWPGARKAIDEFCSEHAIGFTVSAYQQAILHKQAAVG
jgi:O-methyltransferase